MDALEELGFEAVIVARGGHRALPNERPLVVGVFISIDDAIEYRDTSMPDGIVYTTDHDFEEFPVSGPGSVLLKRA
jgi:hypothetical protein